MTVTATDLPLGQDEIDTFWSQGYLVLPGVLTAAEARHFAGLVLNLLPRDLTVPEHWEAYDGRFKPFNTAGNETFDTPEFIPLFQNERLYRAAAQLLDSPRLRAFDGSLAITMRNDTPHDSELSQDLHLDPSTPEEVDQFLFTPAELIVGGCYYLTDVEPGGGALRVVPGGHRLVEREARAVPNGRQLYDKWRSIPHLQTVEVTGSAGDFVLFHHLMPHAASHNRRPAARVAQFLWYARDDQPHPVGIELRDPSGGHRMNDLQLRAMTPLGRRLLGVDPW